MGKGTTTTNASTTSAAPQATQAYSNLLTQAGNVASTPYQAYTGELTAPVNAQQQAGISGINAAAGQAQPGLAAANNQAIASSAPITGQTIQNYQNPYTQQVVNATEAQIGQQNQQQQSQLLGNQISQGALGGNRVGVAQANLGAQQSLANNSTLAGLYSNSYQQALAAAQAQQGVGLAGANAQANFAVQGQNAALTGAGAQLGAGTVEQQTQQQIDAANQAQYAQQQAYPFQTTQWLAGIDTGVAPGLGSSSTGQTTAPPPNQTAQYLGAGLTAASFLARGGGVSGAHYAHGGGVQHFDGGGVAKSPWANAPTWVPTIGLGNAAPHAGSAPSAANTATQAFDYSKIISANNKDSNGLLSGPSYGGGNVLTDSYGGSSSSPLPGLDASDYGAGFARGGIASARYADGGGVDPYPNTDDNMFTASGPDEKIIRAKRNLQTRFNQDAAERTPLWRGINMEMGRGNSADIEDDLQADRTGVSRDRNRRIFPGFADGGAPDVFGDDNRSIAYDLLRSGQTNQPPVSPQTNNGVATPPTWNPDEPYRMPDQAAVDDWRANTPAKGVGTATATPNDDDEPLPPEVANGASKPPAGVGGSDTQALGFAPGAPTSLAPNGPAQTAPQDSGGGLGLLNLSHNARSGLLAAGLGMLASRSPNFGNAIGEGGLAGAAAYGAGEERDRKVAEEAAKLSKEAQNHAEEMKLRTDTQKETARHNKATEEKEYKPAWSVISDSVDPDTGLSKKTYGWVDPNKKVITDSAGRPIAASTSPTPPADTSKAPNPDATGDEFLKSVPPGRAARAKMIGDYEESPADLPTRGGVRAAAVADAKKYNKDFNEQNYQSSQRAYSNFVAGPEARTVRSLNVATDHLDTLRQAAAALKNGQIPMFNNIVNHYREMTGSPLTTNFDSIKQAVSSEIAKTIVGGQTALQDRDEMSNRARNADSPDQLFGIFDQFTKLMGGQMKGLRQQYESGTYRKDFDKFLLPSTKKAIDAVSKDVEPSYEKPKASDAAVAKLKANPGLAPAFDEKYGAGASKQYLGQ